jgi:hypothetical protein
MLPDEPISNILNKIGVYLDIFVDYWYKIYKSVKEYVYIIICS